MTKKKTTKQPKTSQFCKAVRASDVGDVCKPGLQAVREKLGVSHPTGSFDLDTAKKAAEPNNSRWDYGIGCKPNDKDEIAIWVEVHPASTSEVDTMLNKLEWLKGWLKQQKGLKELTEKARQTNIEPFIWVHTDSGVSIRKGSPQARRLQEKGLNPPIRRDSLP
jgi:hypothetical protein